MAIRNDRMGQSWLLPPAVTDLIPEDHICNLVVAVVKSVDVREVEEVQVQTRQSCISTKDAAETGGTGVY